MQKMHVNNKALQISIVAAAGFLVFSVPLEGILHLVPGSPGRRILGSDRGYFEYECYRPFFEKKRAADGTVRYETLRSRTTKESFPAHKGPKTKRVFIVGESAAFVFGGSNTANGWGRQSSITGRMHPFAAV